MYSSGAKRVIDSINSIVGKADGDPVLPGYTAYPYNKNAYSRIEPQEGLLAFIDGGNAEILHTPAFSVFLIRTYCGVFSNGARASAQRHEFYALSWSESGDSYKSRFFPLTDGCVMPGELSLSVDDPTIKDGIFAADIGKMGGIIRKFAEWKLAASTGPGIVVMDGSLQTGITNESTYAEDAFRQAAKKGGCVAGVAKTSSILTTTGNNFLSVLLKNSPFSTWKYHIGENASTCVHAARFHPSSKHAFRIDTEKRADALHVISAIASNCSDYRFPGYPYGLVDADTFARITDGEKAYHKALFLSAAGEHSTHISSSDAHEILDSMKN